MKNYTIEDRSLGVVRVTVQKKRYNKVWEMLNRLPCVATTFSMYDKGAIDVTFTALADDVDREDMKAKVIAIVEGPWARHKTKRGTETTTGQ